MLKLRHIIATGLLSIGLYANSYAEVVNVRTSNYAARSSEFSVKVPGRGMSMDKVQSSFGDASRKISAVGEPPISRWIYSNFTVYFESEYVIHSVVSN